MIIQFPRAASSGLPEFAMPDFLPSRSEEMNLRFMFEGRELVETGTRRTMRSYHNYRMLVLCTLSVALGFVMAVTAHGATHTFL